MSNLTDFIKNDLYPSLFGRVQTAFPDMEFTSYKGGWASKYKLNGELSHDGRMDKSVITRRIPNRVLEQGREGSLSLLDFYGERKGIDTSTPEGIIKAVSELCGICGLQLPEQRSTEEYKAYRDKQERLERIADAMKKALYTEEGRATLDYLMNQRGYKDEFIKWAELGFISAQRAREIRELFTYSRDGQELCSLPNDTGTKYTLAIPYRTAGEIKGFVFRTILSDVPNKYKDAFISETATKKYHLFGLSGLKLTGDKEKDKYITVVEGELDALRATFAGVPNVVAASGGNLSPEALKEAKSRGVRGVTLLFDTEETEEKQRETYKKIEKAIDTIQQEGLSPFVCYIPSDQEGRKADADSYLKDHTGAELQDIIDKAEAGSIFLFRMITDAAIEKQGGEDCTWKNLDEYKQRTIALCNSPYTPPTEREVIIRTFAENTGDYITKEALQEEADILKLAADQNRQKQETISLASEALRLADSGKADEALSLLQDNVGKLKRISMEAEYSSLLYLPTKEEIISRFKERPTGTATGYALDGKDGQEQLFLPNGALTYICAPTSHGKTRMLENLALSLATNKQDGETLFFTYEEDSTAIQMQFLNIFSDMRLSQNNLRTLNSYYRNGSTEYFGRDVNIENFRSKETAFFHLLTSGSLRIYYKPYYVDELIGAIRYLHRQIKVKAVFVDYIQQLYMKGTRLQRKDELKEICKNLMSLSVETGLPIVLGAQLNRETYSPIEMTVQNISEASDIEHSANIVLLLWNSVVKPLPKSRYYITKNGKQELCDEASKLEGKGFHIGTAGNLYITLAKNRGGERNIDAVLNFNGNTGKIEKNYKEKTPVQGTIDYSNSLAHKSEDLPY